MYMYIVVYYNYIGTYTYRCGSVQLRQMYAVYLEVSVGVLTRYLHADAELLLCN